MTEEKINQNMNSTQTSYENFVSLEDFLNYHDKIENKEVLKQIYYKLVSNKLNPKDFFIINKGNFYIPVMRYNYALSLVLQHMQEFSVDIGVDNIGEHAIVRIKRKGYDNTFEWKYYAKEYKTKYSEKYYFMLRKACIVSAIKILFADIFDKFNFYFLLEDIDDLDTVSKSENVTNSNNENNNTYSETDQFVKGLDDKYVHMYNKLKDKYKEVNIDVEQVISKIAHNKFNKKTNELKEEEKIFIITKLYANKFGANEEEKQNKEEQNRDEQDSFLTGLDEKHVNMYVDLRNFYRNSGVDIRDVIQKIVMKLGKKLEYLTKEEKERLIESMYVVKTKKETKVESNY